MTNCAFLPEEKVVLCCSSTRHRRFIDDLVCVLSLPSGSRVSLRYGEDVCDPELRELGNSKLNETLRFPALIAHIKFEELQPQFLPLRRGVIVELRTEGSVTYFEVELGDFVEPLQGADFAKMLVPLARITLPHQAAREEKPVGYFCQRLESAPEMHCGSDTMLWERVAKNFLTAIQNSNADFPFMFHINVVQKGKRESLKIQDGVLRAPSIANLEIRIRTLANRAYFNTTIDAAVGNLEVNVDHPQCRMSTVRPIPIDTTRNFLVSRMVTTISLRPAHGSLVVTARLGSATNALINPVSDVESKTMQKLAGCSHESGNAKISSGPVEVVIVELPITVGRFTSRAAAILLIAIAVSAHALDFGDIELHSELMIIKGIVVFVATALALWLGLKPQAGD